MPPEQMRSQLLFEMNILHITPSFYPATYWGGPIYSVYGLCNALARIHGITLRVLTTDAAGPRCSDAVPVSGFPMRYPDGYEVYFCKRWWAASVAPGMLLRLWPMIRWADVVHLTGVYSPPTIPTLLICRLLNKPVVWSPRGGLQRWDKATRPLLKLVWERVCNALISRKRCVLHVTAETEAGDSQQRIGKAEIKLIPNGVDISQSLPVRTWRPEGRLRLLYLGRLHPIKGLENLFQALTALNDEAVFLTVCGNGEKGYQLRLQQMVRELGLERRVIFRGHVDGDEKTKAFMQADVCMVPSYTENFGMVVAESLAHGVPVVASKGTPWSALEKQDCGLWVDNSPACLADAVDRLGKADLCAMGNRGRNWVEQSFSWGRVAPQMAAIYRRLSGEE